LEWVGIYFFHIILFLLLLIISFLPIFIAKNNKKVSQNTKRFLWSKGIYWIIPALFLLCYVLGKHILDLDFGKNLFLYSLTSSIIALSGYVILIFVNFLVTAPVLALIYSTRKSRFINAVIVERLIAILHSVENYPNMWGEKQFMNNIISNLEYIANSIQHYLFRENKNVDVVTKKQMNEISLQIASGFRDFVSLVLAPNRTTKENFVDSISESLVKVSLGNWGELTRSEPRYAFP